MIYNVVLASGVHQRNSAVYMCIIYVNINYICIFRFFSIVVYYEILNIVSCAIQYALVVYFINSSVLSVNPKFILPPFSSLIAISLCSMSVSLYYK